MTRLDLDVRVNTINTILYEASNAATPDPKPANGRRKKLKVWNDDIAEAVRASKMAHEEWKAAGSRSLEADPTYIAMKVSRAHLRSTIRKHNYLQKQENVDAIMNADEADSKLFYKSACSEV
ncbi:MAG: hypothetical protein ABW185_10005, partial [Sedimenticola sp.]